MATELPNRILRLTSVLDRTGLCRSTLYRKIDGGTFPGQIKISTRCVGWREAEVEVEQWLRNPMFYRVKDYSPSA